MFGTITANDITAIVRATARLQNDPHLLEFRIGEMFSHLLSAEVFAAVFAATFPGSPGARAAEATI